MRPAGFRAGDCARAAIEPLSHLGSLAVRRFLERDWQRHPVLIRQALPGFVSPLTPQAFFQLAQRDEVESRLVQRTGRQWRLDHGPFAARGLPSKSRRGWTLLVQGVDHHVAAGADLLGRFRFVPDARLDDLMVSYASDGGGVGPHIDSYDVFLLQALGRRRWRIQRGADPTLRDGLPLQQLAHFHAEREWILEPGDLLYLPPGVAHDGVAVGSDCMTFSVGFRSPSWADLAANWAEMQAEQAAAHPGPMRIRDAGRDASAHPAKLPAELIDQVQRHLLKRLPRRDDIALALLRHLSEPKPRVTFEAPGQPLPLRAFAATFERCGLRLDARTRMLYQQAHVAINGEIERFADPSATALLRALADRRVLSITPDHRLRPDAATLVLARLYDWYRAGWLHPQI